MAKLLCEVVTPTALLYHGEAALVEIPSIGGYLGVLPGHELFGCRMQNGTVTIYKDADHKEKVVYASYMGFAQVNEDKVTILSRQAIDINDIDVAKVRAERDRLQAEYDAIPQEEADEMAKKRDNVIRGTILDDLDWCNAQLQICEGK